jgi:hypothetical protein
MFEWYLIIKIYILLLGGMLRSNRLDDSIPRKAALGPCEDLEPPCRIIYDLLGCSPRGTVRTWKNIAYNLWCYGLQGTEYDRHMWFLLLLSTVNTFCKVLCLFDFWETNTCPLGIKPTILLGEYGGNITPTEMRNIQSENNLPDSIELGFHVKFTVCG